MSEQAVDQFGIKNGMLASSLIQVVQQDYAVFRDPSWHLGSVCLVTACHHLPNKRKLMFTTFVKIKPSSVAEQPWNANERGPLICHPHYTMYMAIALSRCGVQTLVSQRKKVTKSTTPPIATQWEAMLAHHPDMGGILSWVLWISIFQ